MNFTDISIRNIKLPIVGSIFVLFAGIYAFFQLPMTTYPKITFPTITISANYPGASAEVTDSSVNAIVEQKLQSIENILYTDSSANNRGAASITATFGPDVDQLRALVDVKNAVAEVESRLPSVVRQQGITVSKGQGNLILTVNLLSSDVTKDREFLSNYAEKFLINELSSIKGVSAVRIFGEMKQGVRVWLDPAKMYKHNIDVNEVIASIKSQSAVAAVGRLGQPPVGISTEKETIVVSANTPIDVADFESIIVRISKDVGVVYLKDIAKVQKGSESYDETSKINNSPTVMIGIYQGENGNAVKVSQEVHKRMQDNAKSFPSGVSHIIKYDTSRYITEATDEVIITLFIAFLIVIVVVYSFLRTFVSTLVPALVVPISLFGTILILYCLKIEINLVMLLGLILSIGIVVDDAILVVERTNYLKHTMSLSGMQATIAAMQDVTKPILTTTVVLIIAFIPFYFYPGVQGTLYKQFASAIIISVAISSILALTLSPAMCSLERGNGHGSPAGYKPTSKGKTFHLYKRAVIFFLRNWPYALVIVFLVLFANYLLLKKLTKSFVPTEDPGYLVIAAVLPENSSLARTTDLTDQITSIAKTDSAVDSVIVINGYNFIGGNSSNNGLAFVLLKDWKERKSDELSLAETVDRLRKELNDKLGRQAVLYVFPASTIDGLGSAGGFELKLYNKDLQDASQLKVVAEKFAKEIAVMPEISQANVASSANSPRYELVVNKIKAKAMGIDIDKFNIAIQTFIGSSYITDLNTSDGSNRVILQAIDNFRLDESFLRNIFIRNEQGDLVSAASIASLKRSTGPNSISRFNGRPSLSISGSAEFGNSLSDAVRAIEKKKQDLPIGYTFSWAGEASLVTENSKNAVILLLAACFGVYFVLVVFYESWIIPLAIVLGMPLAAIGSSLILRIFSLDLDTYSTVGIILSVALYAKTVVLVVDRAQKRAKANVCLIRSVLKAVFERNRAILMTAIAFLAGVLPLILTGGAGSASRFTLGLTVIGGVSSTILIGMVIFPAILYSTYKLQKKLRSYTHSIAKHS